VAGGRERGSAAGCSGGSSVESFPHACALRRAMGDVGQTGNRYTINDGSVSNWTQTSPAL
jgi:hypothetical protein